MPLDPSPSSAPRISRRTATALLAAAALGLAVPRVGAGETAARRLKGLARGFNLPNWVDRDEGIAPSDEVLRALLALGLTSVRLPVDADKLGFGDSVQAIAAVQVRAAVEKLVTLGFTVTIDLHSSTIIGDLWDSDHAAAEAAVVSAWTALRPIVAGYPADQVFPELLNEPRMLPKRWNPLRDRLAEVVRETCPDHTIIWGAARFQGIWETLDMSPIPGGNDIAAVHYYTPIGFTHQCENWAGSPLERIANLPFPASRKSPEVKVLAAKLKEAGDDAALRTLDTEFEFAWTVKRIQNDFADIGKWSKRTKTPVLLNEFGVLNFCVDPESRANWTRAVREAAEANGVGWNYWELDEGFGLIADRQSTEGFDTSLIDALLG
jgi:endoglucanase